jgi:heat shock protein HtpX
MQGGPSLQHNPSTSADALQDGNYKWVKLQELIAELAQRAGLRYTPAIILIPQGPVNAAATQSVFFGGKVLVMGDILERLDAGEERVVFAHEMAHLVNRDIWPMLLLRVGSGGIAWQKFGIFIAMITMSYDWLGQLLRTFQFVSPQEVVFLSVACIITMMVHAGYKLGEMAHSRGREYLADVGAVALTGWENRLLKPAAPDHRLIEDWARPSRTQSLHAAAENRI